MRLLMVSLSIAVAGARLAAQTAATVDPGMTREQVVAVLGEPLSSRSYNGFTYLLYRNGCEKKCGMNDLVVLDSGKVIDAVFRSASRHYSGTSSSPRMITQREAKQSNGEVVKTPPPVVKKPPAAPNGAAIPHTSPPATHR